MRSHPTARPRAAARPVCDTPPATPDWPSGARRRRRDSRAQGRVRPQTRSSRTGSWPASTSRSWLSPRRRSFAMNLLRWLARLRACYVPGVFGSGVMVMVYAGVTVTPGTPADVLRPVVGSKRLTHRCHNRSSIGFRRYAHEVVVASLAQGRQVLGLEHTHRGPRARRRRSRSQSRPTAGAESGVVDQERACRRSIGVWAARSWLERSAEDGAAGGTVHVSLLASA